ncbi:hypothetical protein M271_00050 [Streptomyces rapamycinicus NRRL 5491]|uniref:Uncharacterized protein n=2 Tax=Streptomyces rapamycinicus TaxID=1226757 RepID=A0A0A0N4P9_STRRN|nr:hypothetical protein M271_00050 [Streptomyces rapamycinicus NRRL 5491]MBB4779047.1 hypothetical protein [Streptomyces rapamycinicus]MBB4787239.1 hypothetical protein [Streptomyces rapamycinicus]RLV76277.1 hypothetical protein D3C57_143665 [Streptomyces rapamycinicus NRRL 5491]
MGLLSWGFIAWQLMLSQVCEFLRAGVGSVDVIVGWIKR